MSANIQLILPGLFDLPLAELETRLLEQELPHLNRILRLATATPNRAFSIDAMLHAVLAPSATRRPEFVSLPLAQAMVAGDASQDSHLLLFEAVHLQPDLQNAIIVPIPKIQENLNDISIIIKDLGELFKVDCDVSAVGEGLFLMRLREFAAPTHYPHLLSVLGKAVNPYIEQSRQILPWHRLLNEMQMFLHQHEVNQHRMRRGRAAINSLWCWGGGAALPALQARLAWYCDDAVLNRFAAGLGLKPEALAASDRIDRNRNAAVIDLRLIELLKTGLNSGLDTLLLALDRDLLGPLLAAVERNRQSLRLRGGYQLDYQLGPWSGLKFWRRTRNLALLEQLHNAR